MMWDRQGAIATGGEGWVTLDTLAVLPFFAFAASAPGGLLLHVSGAESWWAEEGALTAQGWVRMVLSHPQQAVAGSASFLRSFLEACAGLGLGHVSADPVRRAELEEAPDRVDVAFRQAGCEGLPVAARHLVLLQQLRCLQASVSALGAGLAAILRAHPVLVSAFEAAGGVHLLDLGPWTVGLSAGHIAVGRDAAAVRACLQ